MFAQEYAATVQTIQTALAKDPQVSVVTESTGLIKALSAGKCALLVNPPAIDFQTYSVWTSEYLLLLVAPRTVSNVAAAGVLAPVIEALATSLPGGIDSARPYDYTLGDENYIVPAYEITYTGE